MRQRMSRVLLSARDLDSLPIFPLPNLVFFPGSTLPLHVFEERYRALTRDVLASPNKVMGIARLKPGYETDYEGRPPVFDICGVGSVVESEHHADGRYDITLRGIARVRILEELPAQQQYRRVRAELLRELPPDPALSAAWQRKLSSIWTVLAPHLPEPVRDLRALTRGAESAGEYADLLAAALVGDPDGSQQLLAELDPAERLRLLVEKLERLLDSVKPAASSRRPDLN